MFRKLLISTVLIISSLFSQEIGIYEDQIKEINLNTVFTTEYNEKKSLKEIINNKPTILTINYFNCPTLCSPLLYEVADIVQKVQLKEAKDFNIITLSIEKNDSFIHAKNTKDKIFKTIKTKFQTNAWTFLTTKNQKDIDELTSAVGFKYERRVKDGVFDYLHPAAIIVLTPKGKISRYLNGVRYLPFDLKMALLEASDEKTRPTIANTLLFCFAYDPESKSYVLQGKKIMGSFIFGSVFIFFIYLLKTGRKEDDK